MALLLGTLRFALYYPSVSPENQANGFAEFCIDTRALSGYIGTRGTWRNSRLLPGACRVLFHGNHKQNYHPVTCFR